jgi:siroheme synthase-like protein
MRADALGLPITLDLQDARVIVVGPDDEERRRKLLLLADAGASVLTLERFSDEDLQGARMVMLTAHDPAQAARVAEAARRAGALVWCADDPAHSDFAMPAVARVGSARLAISTGGAAPALASRLRVELEEQLGDEFARFVERLAQLRADVQRDEPDFAQRRELLNRALDGFAIEVRLRYPAVK